MPGVHAVLTAADLPEPMRTERIPNLMANPAIRIMRTQHALARDEVCYAGQAVAVVIADSRALAEDAAALVVVDYDVLPAVEDCREAVKPGAPRAHADMTDNIAAALKMDYGDVDAAFAKARACVRGRDSGCIAAAACRWKRARSLRATTPPAIS